MEQHITSEEWEKQLREVWTNAFGSPEEGEEIYWPHKYNLIKDCFSSLLQAQQQTFRETLEELKEYAFNSSSGNDDWQYIKEKFDYALSQLDQSQ